MGMPGEAPRKRRKRNRSAAPFAMASFLVVLPAQAETSSQATPRELEAAKKFELPALPNERPICKAPQVEAAARKLESGIAAINKAVDDIQDAAFREGRDALAVEERAQTEALEAQRNKLKASLKTLNALPSCEALLAAYQNSLGAGMQIGLHLIETRARVRGGAGLTYPMQPWGAEIVVAPFLSADWLGARARHSLPGGGFARVSTDAAATAGVKIGPRLSPQVWTYAIGGLTVANETVSSALVTQSSAALGVTAGAGIAFRPQLLQALGKPYSVFVEYRHGWLDALRGSPLLGFRREIDAVSVGVGVPLGFPPPPTKLPAE
jgi:hypothetical protein